MRGNKFTAIALNLKIAFTDFFQRASTSFRKALPKSLRTSLWIIKITLPVSLAVSILNFYGFLALISEFLTPVLKAVGLRGEAAIAFVTGVFLNIYSVIAVISQLSLSLREVTILAVMSLIAHNLIVETAVQAKTGSKAWHMVALRLGMAFFAAFLLNHALPALDQAVNTNVFHGQSLTLLLHLQGWLSSALKMVIKILVLVFLLMVLQEALKEFKLIELMTAPLLPFMKALGLPRSTSFLWIVANTLGLAYGSAVMMEEVGAERVKKTEADLLNYHVAISHSNLEDLLLFAAIGVSIPWMLGIRILIAAGAVWSRRCYLTRNGEVFN